MLINEIAFSRLSNERKRLLISLENAEAKPNVSQSELDSLRSKLEINSYLLMLVEADVKRR